MGGLSGLYAGGRSQFGSKIIMAGQDLVKGQKGLCPYIILMSLPKCPNYIQLQEAYMVICLIATSNIARGGDAESLPCSHRTKRSNRSETLGLVYAKI